MISVSSEKLYALAKNHFEEALTLAQNNRFDGAVYLCGYAVELVLKRHICKILGWEKYPPAENQESYKSFMTHKLDVLLNLAGLEKKIQSDDITFAQWQIVRKWDSEIRYKEIGTFSQVEAKSIIDATRSICNLIFKL